MSTESQLVLLVIALVSSPVSAHPNGAPVTSCDTMFPKHKHTAQTESCPFETVPSQTKISSGRSLNVTLQTSSSTNEEFKGYLIMAFDQSNPELAIGTFETDSHSHTIDCHGRAQSAATHSSKSYKSKVHLIWTPPADFKGDVVFMTTWVVSKRIFWLKEVSGPVHVGLTSSAPADETIIEVQRVLSFSLSGYVGVWAMYGLLTIAFLAVVAIKVAAAKRSNEEKKYAILVN